MAQPPPGRRLAGQTGVPAAGQVRGRRRWRRSDPASAAAPHPARTVGAPRGEVVAADDCVEALWGEGPAGNRADGAPWSCLRAEEAARPRATENPGARLPPAPRRRRRGRHPTVRAPGEQRRRRTVALPVRNSWRRRSPSSVASRSPTSATRSSQARRRVRLNKLRLLHDLEEQIQTALEASAATRRWFFEAQSGSPSTTHSGRAFAHSCSCSSSTAREGRRMRCRRSRTRATCSTTRSGSTPGPALQRLEHQILNQDAELAAPNAFAPVRHASPATKPSGIVTFLLTSAEGPAREPVQTVVGQHGGFELDADGDCQLVAFARARDAGCSRGR